MFLDSACPKVHCRLPQWTVPHSWCHWEPFWEEPNERSHGKWDESCEEAAHPSRRTSGSDRLRAIISEAMRLNWLILNISFIFSWFSLGITTGFPPSPGPSRGLVRASAVHTHIMQHNQAMTEHVYHWCRMYMCGIPDSPSLPGNPLSFLSSHLLHSLK